MDAPPHTHTHLTPTSLRQLNSTYSVYEWLNDDTVRNVPHHEWLMMNITRRGNHPRTAYHHVPNTPVCDHYHPSILVLGAGSTAYRLANSNCGFNGKGESRWVNHLMHRLSANSWVDDQTDTHNVCTARMKRKQDGIACGLRVLKLVFDHTHTHIHTQSQHTQSQSNVTWE